MLRREAISLLAAACTRASAAVVAASLGGFFETDQGTALLVDVKTRRLIGVHGERLAAAAMVPPGSAIKPFVLAALLRSGKLRADERFVCPGRLTVGGHSLTCSHPRLDRAFEVRTALAYSCNCFVAHFADRFGPGELAAGLERAGLASGIRPARGQDANRLQALGEEGVLVTPTEMAMGYRWLALGPAAEMRSIVDGLEGAVEYGTAQLARVEGFPVAGKTGSVRMADGMRVAWFAGFAPSRAPEVAMSVMLQGRSGGADAAPVAGRILAAYHAGRLQ